MAGCSDAKMKQFTTIGSQAEIVCYSAGKEIYKGKSIGKVSTEEHSDGWFFEEEGTYLLIRISADCIIRN